MQSCYFEIDKLGQPDKNAQPGYEFVGFVFVEAVTEEGKTVFFPWQRYKDTTGKYLVVEVHDINKAGCPYPPPCKSVGFKDCYD